ncbi:MAG: hypothetical protein M3Y70_09770 [Pseudomonadota bacterium]|nr:hypothetical protein [Pseudomonadota bacterium]
MAINAACFAPAQQKRRPLNAGERELHRQLCIAYPGRVVLALNDFLRDFLPGRDGRPMQRKTALNRIYGGTFPVPVIEDRVWLVDIAIWLYRERTKHAQCVVFFG